MQKLLSSYTVVKALYTYQIPFNHQIKRVAAALWGAVWDISIFIHYKGREVKNKVGDPIY